MNARNITDIVLTRCLCRDLSRRRNSGTRLRLRRKLKKHDRHQVANTIAEQLDDTPLVLTDIVTIDPEQITDSRPPFSFAKCSRREIILGNDYIPEIVIITCGEVATVDADLPVADIPLKRFRRRAA